MYNEYCHAEKAKIVNLSKFASQINQINIDEINKKKYAYQMYPNRNNTIISIITFRKMLENIQNNINNEILNSATIKEYCLGISNLGISHDSIIAEITSAIFCINNTKLSEYNIRLQESIQEIFFPFETYLCSISNLKNQQSPRILHVSSENASKNLIKLIKKLQKVLLHQKLKNLTLKDGITEEYIVMLKNNIQRLQKQADKLASISSHHISRQTYNKLIKIASRNN